MPLRLTEKSRAKTAMGFARTDNLVDDIVVGMIEELSTIVEDTCGREFEKKERVEYCQSFDQGINDPVPQYLKLKSWPIDLAEPFTIVFSGNDDHDNTGIELVRGTDYTVDVDRGEVIVRALSQQGTRLLPVANSFIYSYAPRGFKVTYTGGYTAVDTESSPPDPLDDYGMIQVPLGLRSFIASKIGADYLAKKQIQPLKPEEMQSLYPYRR